MDQTITFRKATSADAALLADLGRKAFVAAFGTDNTEEDMAAYLAGSFSKEIQARELAQEGCVFIIAETEIETGTIPVGYSRLQAGTTESSVTGLRPVELVRFYMLPDWIGINAGSRLMQETLEVARGRGYDVVWLGVWEKNARAIRFYQKWGFTTVGTHSFLLGSDAQTDFVMQRSLE